MCLQLLYQGFRRKKNKTKQNNQEVSLSKVWKIQLLDRFLGDLFCIKIPNKTKRWIVLAPFRLGLCDENCT